MSSSEVKAEVKTWVGTFVKLLLGFSGAIIEQERQAKEAQLLVEMQKKINAAKI